MSTTCKYTLVGMLTSRKPTTVEAVVEGLKIIGFDLETDDELTPVAGCPTRLFKATHSFYMSFETTDRYLAGRLNQFIKGQKAVLHEGSSYLLVPKTRTRFAHEKSLFLARLQLELPPNQQSSIFSRDAWDGEDHKNDWIVAQIKEHLEESRMAFKAFGRDVKKPIRHCLEEGGLPKTHLD